MNTNNEENNDISERISKYEVEMTEFARKLEIKPTISPEFPQFRILPEDLQLALLIVNKYNCQYMIQYKDLRGTK